MDQCILVSPCKTRQASQAITLGAWWETTHVRMHIKSRKHVHGVSASVLMTCSPLCPVQKPAQFAPFIPALKPGPVLRASEEAQSCVRPALLEKHISYNLALSSCRSGGPCQVPVFDSPLYQAVASSFPGHPATFQKKQDWRCLGQQRHTASLTSHYYELACTMNSVEELSI